MVIPFHEYASVPVSGPTAAAHERLMAAPQEEVAAATAQAISDIRPLTRSWGLRPTVLPTVTASPTDDDQLGSVEVRWEGIDAETAWPSLTARLLVVPSRVDGGTRLVLLSPRSPGVELTTAALDRVERRRGVEVPLRCFLSALAERLRDPATPPLHEQHDVTTHRRPLFVHHVLGVAADPDELAAWLRADPGTLAEDVTAAALDAAADTLAAGRFRTPARPRIVTAGASASRVGVVDLGWASDEEATGWPPITLTLVVEADTGGSRIAVLSEREPSYDMSLNRVDKHQRNQVLSTLGANVLDAITRSLPAAPTEQLQQRELQAAN